MSTAYTPRRMAPLSAVLALAAAPCAVLAFNPQPDPPGFGMVGITQGQAVVLNVVLGDPPGDIEPPGPDRACQLTLSFVDASGRALMTASGQSVTKQLTLRPRIADALEFAASEVFGAGHGRHPIRALVSYPTDQRTLSD
ncbi:MAG: hypothetical protein ACREN5_08995, partial [Gemmatimonadales bacterium]